MFEKKCCNGGNKHKFRPRYDQVSDPKEPKFSAQGCNPIELIQAYTKVTTTYIHDICEWCGKTVSRYE